MAEQESSDRVITGPGLYVNGDGNEVDIRGRARGYDDMTYEGGPYWWSLAGDWYDEATGYQISIHARPTPGQTYYYLRRSEWCRLVRRA